MGNGFMQERSEAGGETSERVREGEEEEIPLRIR